MWGVFMKTILQSLLVTSLFCASNYAKVKQDQVYQLTITVKYNDGVTIERTIQGNSMEEFINDFHNPTQEEIENNRIEEPVSGSITASVINANGKTIKTFKALDFPKIHDLHCCEVSEITQKIAAYLHESFGFDTEKTEDYICDLLNA